MINNCYEPDREETIDKILCNRCKHRRKGITCDAFPNGIPIEIIRSGEHFLPLPGDNGIVFEEKQCHNPHKEYVIINNNRNQ